MAAPAAPLPQAPGPATALEAFHLPRDRGQRLCVLRTPRGAAPRGALLHVPAFGEEMNKSRRMVALQSQALAQAGWAVLQLDLDGCGDSSGDLADAGWDGWVDDVCAAAGWLRERSGHAPVLWGQRTGCLLAAQAADRLGVATDLLFWQPVVNGQTALTQFLRLKAAAVLQDGQGKAVMDGLRSTLAAGGTVEVAGYCLPAAVANGLGRAMLAPPAAANTAARLAWIEVSSRPQATLSPAAEQALGRWRGAGWQAAGQVVEGPGFWQTTEIEDAPALLPATLAALAFTPAPAPAAEGAA